MGEKKYGVISKQDLRMDADGKIDKSSIAAAEGVVN
jgi:hypothetical protein